MGQVIGTDINDHCSLVSRSLGLLYRFSCKRGFQIASVIGPKCRSGLNVRSWLSFRASVLGILVPVVCSQAMNAGVLYYSGRATVR